MPSLYGDNLEAVVSGGEQVTADLGEALYLVMEGQKGEQGDRGPDGPLAELDASYNETTKTLTLGTKTVSYVRLWIDVETGELVVGSTSWNYLKFALTDDGYLEVEL